MAVIKGQAQVLGEGGTVLGSGTAYIHLPKGRGPAQTANGTISLRSWNAAPAPPAQLSLDDGLTLAIEVTAEALSECSRNHILRYRARWPGESA